MSYTYTTFNLIGITHPASKFIPDGLNDDDPAPLVILHHGNEENEAAWQTPSNPAYAPVRDAMIAQGWRLAAARALGNNWGNEPGMLDYSRLYSRMAGSYNVSKVLHIGVSMGGLTALLTASRHNEPPPDATVVPADGVALMAPACNLRTLWDAQGGIAALIEDAYDISPPGDLESYLANTTNHDPMLRLAKLADVPIRIYHSPDDGTIPYANNSRLLIDTLAPLSDFKNVLRISGGDHTAESQFQADDVVAFFQDCIAGTVSRRQGFVG